MKIVQQIYAKVIEIALLLILMLLPFSYKMINPQWIVFLSISLCICVLMHLSKKIKPANYRIWGVIYALLFMFIFDMAEKVNIIRYIPLSTVLLAIAMLAFMVKILVEGKVRVIRHPFMKYFFYACSFLFILMILFYPFFFHYYQMSLDSNIQLANKIIKYIFLFVLISNYLSDEKKFKKINLGFILSLTVTIILSILL